ncbi:ras GEF [Guyanagaster necrorhizus]|uniref:Ras GEF n=1 Tax=Guyanagaster necrorhizus TaxID=856835 RepID=A0A9P7W1W2_9AGAR|nr:ras GEF [Guyanagaster necrorhizus MCA 3950]KAG7450495.1 ras GEF [Guyanagaster necrorhizus MCA 3950]
MARPQAEQGLFSPTSLPALMIPDGPSSSCTTSSHSDNSDHVAAAQSPAPSQRSRDSFSTALNSPSQIPVDFVEPQPAAASLLPLPPSLRKSISVDSFVHYGRDHSSITTRPNCGHTGSSLDPPKGFVFDVTKKLDRDRRLLGRNRGTSISTVGDDHESVVGESDIERSDVLNSPTDGYKLGSLKGHDKGKTFVSGGELPLPSRTPTLSTTSSMSSIMTTSPSSSTQEGVHRMQSASSLQSVPRRGIPVASPVGRTRSGSLGVYTPSSNRRMVINTTMSPPETVNQNLAVTLVVVGVAGCGKSMVIRKGLRGYGLSDPSAPLLGSQHASRYTRRVGKLPQADNTRECPLNIIEVDIPLSIPDTSVSTVNFLPEAPRVDGVLICYDASDEQSFRPVEALLRGYRALQLPTVVLACKSDLSRRIDPQAALDILQQYDVGLVEVHNADDSGKEKMRRSFDWLLKAVLRDRRSSRSEFEDYRNPASPDILILPPWEKWESSRTPTVASSTSTHNSVQAPATHIPQPQHPSAPLPSIPASRTATPNPPVRARSTGDLLSEQEKFNSQDLRGINDTENSNLSIAGQQENNASVDLLDGRVVSADVPKEVPEEKKASKLKDSRPAQWATLDELLDKLLFLGVSGDDPTYITHFLLTYRRFASPRSLLLAMQKRMRQLDSPSGDPMFACYAQMRICHLLELWIRDYPYDFAVRGTAGALSALIKSIISKTYLLHYGSDFLPFLEVLPNLVDLDAAWALKVEDPADESDDSYSLLEDDDDGASKSEADSLSYLNASSSTVKAKPATGFRERKGSLPLSAKALLPQNSHVNDDPTPKEQLKILQRVAQEVNATDPEEIAQEITRLESKLFLQIRPRHWLNYTFVSGKKDPEVDAIARFNSVSNHLADWVVSLILCHDKARARAKQIEKFVDVAQKLRTLNNYSALRAFVAGINNATFPGDQTMEQFKTKAPDHAKNLQSWDVLLQHIRSHRAYRLALRNTKGACIPALEVHISDLIRSHEGNDDFHSDDATKVHWGKFNMMGRFITNTTQCQAQCLSTMDYNFVERPNITQMLQCHNLMDEEMQKSRIAPPDVDFDEYRPAPPRPLRDPPQQPKDVAILRRLLFW